MQLNIRGLQFRPCAHEGKHWCCWQAKETTPVDSVTQHLPAQAQARDLAVICYAFLRHLPFHTRRYMVAQILAHSP